MHDPVAELCVCPHCRSALERHDKGLGCTTCGRTYPVVEEVPVLLPEYSEERERYRLNYERMAEDDLVTPIVQNRFELMHRQLIGFVGNTRGQNILDVGSAYGSYLCKIEASHKVAVDLALPYLRAMALDSEITRVCGDAEALPVRLSAFDVVIISDILEHLLEPERLVNLLAVECRDDVRVIVHIPWRESIRHYEQGEYEFSHLRSFDEYSFRLLFWMFEVRHERDGLPRLDEPVLFRLKSRLPRRLYNELVHLYFTTSLSEIEYRYRERWIHELPRRERLLLRFFEPQVKLFELRKRTLTNRFVRAMVDAWDKRLSAAAARVPAGQRESGHPVMER
jgi:uncharacterized protein YbaR (Trm112 family)